MMSITNIYGFRIYQNFLLGAVAIVYLMLEILEANTLKEYPRYPGPRPGEFQMPSKFFYPKRRLNFPHSILSILFFQKRLFPSLPGRPDFR